MWHVAISMSYNGWLVMAATIAPQQQRIDDE
jgi:hypothetical protein